MFYEGILGSIIRDRNTLYPLKNPTPLGVGVSVLRFIEIMKRDEKAILYTDCSLTKSEVHIDLATLEQVIPKELQGRVFLMHRSSYDKDYADTKLKSAKTAYMVYTIIRPRSQVVRQ